MNESEGYWKVHLNREENVISWTLKKDHVDKFYVFTSIWRKLEFPFFWMQMPLVTYGKKKKKKSNVVETVVLTYQLMQMW